MRGWFIPVVLLVAAIALPFVVPTYYVQFVSKAFIMGILAMALNLAVGHGGLVSLCHAAFFGLAGYVLALLSPGYDPASLLLTLPAAMLAADVTRDPLVPSDGGIDVRRVVPDPALLDRFAADEERTAWWLARLEHCHAVLAA